MRNRKEYMRSYQTKWLNGRRNAWLIINGPCKLCGSNKDLEIDHIHPSTKEHNPRSLWSRTEEIRSKELNKCQVLCKVCHRKKTRIDLSVMNKGKLNLVQRKWTDGDFLKVKELVMAGHSERGACRLLGIPRGTYSSIKIRGHR